MEQTHTELSRHRHFVAFPLFALMFAVTTALPLWVTQLPAQLTGGLPNGLTAVTLGGGGHGIAYANTVWEEGDVLTVTKGAITAASDGFLALQSGVNSLYGFDGAMHITRSDRGLTVAALTTPVVVVQGNMRMIVPRGMQWTEEEGTALEALSAGPDSWKAGRALTLLPTFFIREKLTELARLPAGESGLPLAVKAAPVSLSHVTDALLPSALQGAVADWHMEVLGSVRYALEQLDTAQLRVLLQREEFAEVFASPDGVSGLLLLLSLVAGEDTALQMPMMETLVHDEIAWLLLSYHQDYDDVAWTFDRADLSRESRFIRLYVFPESLQTAQETPAIAPEKWKTGWSEILRSMEDPSVMLRFVLSSSVPMLDRLDALQLPQRSRELARVLGELLSPFASLHDEVSDALSMLDSRAGVTTVSLPQEIVIPETPNGASASAAFSSTSSSEVPAPEVPDLKPEEVVAKAHDILRVVDAVYSLKTTVEAVSGSEARIEHVVFASSSGDHTVSLTLNIVTGSVHDITINGQTGFPYTPRFESFVAWLKK